MLSRVPGVSFPAAAGAACWVTLGKAAPAQRLSRQRAHRRLLHSSNLEVKTRQLALNNSPKKKKLRWLQCVRRGAEFHPLSTTPGRQTGFSWTSLISYTTELQICLLWAMVRKQVSIHSGISSYLICCNNLRYSWAGACTVRAHIFVLARQQGHATAGRTRAMLCQ